MVFKMYMISEKDWDCWFTAPNITNRNATLCLLPVQYSPDCRLLSLSHSQFFLAMFIKLYQLYHFLHDPRLRNSVEPNSSFYLFPCHFRCWSVSVPRCWRKDHRGIREQNFWQQLHNSSLQKSEVWILRLQCLENRLVFFLFRWVWIGLSVQNFQTGEGIMWK